MEGCRSNMGVAYTPDAVERRFAVCHVSRTYFKTAWDIGRGGTVGEV
ncbi:hypothetical protein [Prevotella nigrescens]|nr:hypothetical protein [Prevotella nigrescens]